MKRGFPVRGLIYISLCLAIFACRSGAKKKKSEEAAETPTPASAKVVPEVASHVQVITSDTGQVRAEAVPGASKYGVRILDANCSKEVANLGVQESPDFTLPASAYQKPLCMETTYYSSKSKVIEVKMQPFNYEGPQAVNAVMAEGDQILDFPPVKGAMTYSYVVTDRNGKLVLSDTTTDSKVDLKDALDIGSYNMIIRALDPRGKTIKVMNYDLEVTSEGGVGPDEDITLNLTFERERYQTRSIKRVLIDATQVRSDAALQINEQDLETTIIESYQGAYAALLDASDAMMRGVLDYSASTAAVMVPSLSSQTYNLPVEVKDFNLFGNLPVAFSDQSYEKGGLEAWSSSLEAPLVRSGDSILTADFGVMILQ